MKRILCMVTAVCMLLGMSSGANAVSLDSYTDSITQLNLKVEEDSEIIDIPADPIAEINESGAFSAEGFSVRFVASDVPIEDEKENAVLRANLPDLALRDVRVTDYDKPFPLNEEIPFLYNIYNLGTAPSTKTTVSVYVGGSYLGSANFSALQNGYRREMVTFISAPVNGRFLVKFVVNEDRSMAESDYLNNEDAMTATWGTTTSPVGLAAYSFDSDDGRDEFLMGERHKFNFSVANFGTSTVTNVPVGFTVNGKIKQMFTLNGDIPSGKARSGSITIGYTSIAKVSFGIVADPENTTNDPLMDDNYLYKMYYVTGPETFPGRWSSARNLTVQSDDLLPDIYSLTALSSATQAWNGITSNVSIGSVQSYSTDLAEDINFDLRHRDTELAGEAVYYVSNGSGGWTTVDGTKYSGTYEKIRIQIYDDQFDGLSTKLKKAVVTHEVGHALGLAHPSDCNSPTIMRPHGEGNLAAETIQEHDRYNLKKIYG